MRQTDSRKSISACCNLVPSAKGTSSTKGHEVLLCLWPPLSSLSESGRHFAVAISPIIIASTRKSATAAAHAPTPHAITPPKSEGKISPSSAPVWGERSNGANLRGISSSDEALIG